MNLQVQLREKSPNDAKRLGQIAKDALDTHSQKYLDGMGLLRKIKDDLKQIQETNQKLSKLANQIPVYEGLYPTQQKFDDEKNKLEQDIKNIRKDAMNEILLNRIKSRKVKNESSE